MKSVGDFVTEARAHRGGLNYASTGVGTISHLVMESLKLAADIDIVHVPYRGAAPALNDLQAGQVQGMFTSTASAAPLVAGEQAAAARRHHAGALAADARRADHGGGRLADGRGRGVGRHHGAGWRAADDRAQAGARLRRGGPGARGA